MVEWRDQQNVCKEGAKCCRDLPIGVGRAWFWDFVIERRFNGNTFAPQRLVHLAKLREQVHELHAPAMTMPQLRSARLRNF